ncbi:MAG: 16S rRNA (guanine(527)-N(7))-methyltransferase RsmG [Desulfuromonas sp.]|nr:MAG: 16S rRNA (guanine(527)-N(7))-methyltransferase RsmG [Desulfuromonas sp.]
MIGQLDRLRIEVPGEALDPMLWLLDELLRWNRRINLTAITDPLDALEKHLVDSLSLVPLLEGTERLLDIGSGGGFPSLPVKLALRGLKVVSVDAVGKKVSFQRHVVRSLGLSGFEPLHARVEGLAGQAGRAAGFDLVVSRAFASLGDFARLARPFLASGGRIVAMKGSEGERELGEDLFRLEALGLRCSSLERFRLPASGAERTLVVMEESISRP